MHLYFFCSALPLSLIFSVSGQQTGAFVAGSSSLFFVCVCPYLSVLALWPVLRLSPAWAVNAKAKNTLSVCRFLLLIANGRSGHLLVMPSSLTLHKIHGLPVLHDVCGLCKSVLLFPIPLMPCHLSNAALKAESQSTTRLSPEDNFCIIRLGMRFGCVVAQQRHSASTALVCRRLMLRHCKATFCVHKTNAI